MQNIKEEHIMSAEDYNRLKSLSEEFLYILNKYRYPYDLCTSPLTLLKNKAYDVSYALVSVEHE